MDRMMLQGRIRAAPVQGCAKRASLCTRPWLESPLQQQHTGLLQSPKLVSVRAASGDDDVPGSSSLGNGASPAPGPAPSTSSSRQSSIQQRAEAAFDKVADLRPSVTTAASTRPPEVQTSEAEELETYEPTAVQKFLFPEPDQMPERLDMPIWDHLEELRERVLVAGLATVVAIGTCFAFAKDLVVFLEAPVADAGVRFLQLSPGEFFFTTFQVAGYAGLLVAAPTILYEIVAYVVPGLTRSERQFLAPVVFSSSILFYAGLLFSYEILTPAALNFFVDYASGAVESLYSIQSYFTFVLTLMLSTGLAFQVPVIQFMLGSLGLVTGDQMLSQWRYVVVGSTVAAAVLTPSTDPFTQTLLAVPLVGLYMAGALAVKGVEGRRASTQ